LLLYNSNNYEKISINCEKTIYNCKFLCYNCNRIIIGGDKMLTCEGYKMFRGSMKVGAHVIEGVWLYKPEHNCWYCNGSSYPAEVCTILVDNTN